WLKHARERLAGAGVDAPALDAELLLACALQRDRCWVLAHPEYTMTPSEHALVEQLLGRRQRREPLAYILGSQPFFGLDLLVTPAVLIPRPETEELVEHAIRWLNQRAAGQRDTLAGLRVVDVGTGSGAIALALASALPELHIIAVDDSLPALKIAQENTLRLGLAKRVHLVAGDLLLPFAGTFDLILANLPYIPSAELPTLMPEVSQYEPRRALDGGRDGLGPLRRLLAQAHTRLAPEGALMAEIGAEQGSQALRAAHGLLPDCRARVEKDLAGRDRILIVEHTSSQDDQP
ncbi:MAG: peptide chain release factor N(5)-glutamine methyltransferase, partial [Anaerolineae bacterium]